MNPADFRCIPELQAARYSPTMSPIVLSLRSCRTALCLSLWGLAGTLSAVAQQAPPKAIPVEEETAPGPAPRPAAPKATPVPETDTEPAPERPAAKPAPRPASGGNLVKSPEDDLFDYCELLYSRSSFALAAQQYQNYLNLHPLGKHREQALFKTGECFYNTEKWEQAIQQYDALLREFPNSKNKAVVYFHAGEAYYKLALLTTGPAQAERMRLAYDGYQASIQAARTGPYACYSAFRLGRFAYNAAQREPERYRDAAKWFEIAASQAPKSQPTIRVTSLYYMGRAQRYLKENKAAAATFQLLTQIKEGNEYYDRAWQELAQMDVEAGRTDEAMKKFERLAQDSADAETRANSLVNTGMILAEAGKAAEAIAKFEEALQVPGEKAKAARSRARFGLVWSSYKEKAFDKVIEAWRGLQGEDYNDLDASARARLWLIVGTAYAAQEKHSPAAQTLALLNNLIDTPEPEVREACLEGGYKRIVSLFKLGDPSTPDIVDEFASIWNDRAPNSPWLDKAWLVKGAWYFNRSVWDAAARAYKNVREDKLEKEKVATWLYQKGCAEASSGDKAAVESLSSFLDRSADDERAPMAQLQRGLVRMKLDDLTNSLADFEAVAAKVPGTETGETAAYNAARVKGMKQDFQGMVDGFAALLKNYPKTQVAAEANYWIGTGSYQLQKYADCLEPLRKARGLEGRLYFQDASLMLVAALAALKDLDGLIPEVDAYLKANTEKRISPDILRWLGMTLFRERKDFARTARYLGFVVTFDTPEKTSADVWAAHGESLLEIKDYAGAVIALGHYLKAEQRPAQRARAFLLLGRAQFALKQSDAAMKSVEEGLSIDRETLIAAQLHMLSGDIAVAANRSKEAISSYNAVRATWEDPVLTPTAIHRMIALLEKSTDAKEVAEAENLKKDLAQRYPRFQPQP